MGCSKVLLFSTLLCLFCVGASGRAQGVRTSPTPRPLVPNTVSMRALSGSSSPPRPQRPSKNAVVYAVGTIGTASSTTLNFAIANALAVSNFSTAIIGFLHFHPDQYADGLNCTLSIDNNRICDFDPGELSAWLNTVLHAPGSNISTILLSIGGGGNICDYYRMQQNWTIFLDALSEFMTQYPVLRGIDLDMEGDTPTNYADVLDNLAAFAVANGYYLTIAPAQDIEEWYAFVARNWVINQQGNNDTVVSWVNYQLYGSSPAGFDVMYILIDLTFPQMGTNIMYPGYGMCANKCKPYDAMLQLEIMHGTYSGGAKELQGAFAYSFMTSYTNPTIFTVPGHWGTAMNFGLALLPNTTTTTTNVTTTTSSKTTIVDGMDSDTSTTSTLVTTTFKTHTHVSVQPRLPPLLQADVNTSVAIGDDGQCAYPWLLDNKPSPPLPTLECTCICQGIVPGLPPCPNYPAGSPSPSPVAIAPPLTVYPPTC